MSTWAATIRAFRSQLFVGRGLELHELSDFLEGEVSRLCVVVGVAGIGKSTLVEQWRATLSDRVVRFIDGAENDTTEVFEAALLGAAPELILVENFERLETLYTWLRKTFLPRLDSSTKVVVVTRQRLPEGWRNDVGWKKLISEIHVGALSDSESKELLRRLGTPETEIEKRALLAHGHPLGLTVSRQLTPAAQSEVDEDDVYREVARELRASPPTPMHQRALWIAAVVHSCDEELLRVGLEVEDARPLMEWLLRCGFFEPTSHGLVMHDLLRDALVTDLSWRDPAAYQDIVLRVCRPLARRAQSASAENRYAAIRSMFYPARMSPMPFWRRFRVRPEAYTTAATVEEAAVFYEAVARHEGRESAAHAQLDAECKTLKVLRDHTDRAVGFIHYLHVNAAGLQAEAQDPMIRVLRGALEAVAPLADEDLVIIARHWFAMDGHQGGCAVATDLLFDMTVTLCQPQVALGLSVMAHATMWNNRPDNQHTLFGTWNSDGIEFGAFGQDWRAKPRFEWFERMIAGMISAPLPTMPAVLRVERAAFARAVRGALRDYHRDGRLKENILFKFDVVPARSSNKDRADVEDLRGWLHAAIADLGAHGDNAIHRELLLRTFVEQKGKQLGVAAEVNMGYSTYRRHLRAAVDHLSDRLWTDLSATPPS